jgi:hypothetical protein
MNMEQLKVKKIDILVVNLIVYLFLSFVFLYLQYAYRHHLSPFSLAYFRKSFELFWYILGPLMLSILAIWKHHKWSAQLYSFCVLVISYKVIEGLFIEFNKIIVIALFCYISISYFLYQLFNHYLSLASLNPNYRTDDLFDPILREISCQANFEQESCTGYLTNWDEEGCFIHLDPSKLPRVGVVDVKITFKGRTFEQRGEVVAHSVDFKGIGIKFGKTPKGLSVFNWDEFTELIDELGYKPERLR